MVNYQHPRSHWLLQRKGQQELAYWPGKHVKVLRGKSKRGFVLSELAVMPLAAWARGVLICVSFWGARRSEHGNEGLQGLRYRVIVGVASIASRNIYLAALLL